MLFRSERLKSQGKNTPYLGQSLAGEVIATLVAGHVVYEASHDEKLRTPRSESPRAARAAARR